MKYLYDYILLFTMIIWNGGVFCLNRMSTVHISNCKSLTKSFKNYEPSPNKSYRFSLVIITNPRVYLPEGGGRLEGGGTPVGAADVGGGGGGAMAAGVAAGVACVGGGGASANS